MNFERGWRQRHGPQAPWKSCRNAKNLIQSVHPVHPVHRTHPAHPLTKPRHRDDAQKGIRCIMHFERGRRQRHGPQAPWRTCRNAKNFTIFEEEPLCFNMRLNYKISTRVILIFLPLYLPSSSTLLMGAGAVYFIKILHQHFDDNDLWKKWFNFSCNNSSRAGTWNLQQDCHKEAYMIPSSKAYFQKFWECFKVIHPKY